MLERLRQYFDVDTGEPGNFFSLSLAAAAAAAAAAAVDFQRILLDLHAGLACGFRTAFVPRCAPLPLYLPLVLLLVLHLLRS